MDIRVQFNGFNYDAHDTDSHDGAPDSRQNQLGYGETKEDAVADLYEQLGYVLCDHCAQWIKAEDGIALDEGDVDLVVCSPCVLRGI